jgi:hypothetical protein
MSEKYMPSYKVNDKAMNMIADIVPAQCAEVYFGKTWSLSPVIYFLFRHINFHMQ